MTGVQTCALPICKLINAKDFGLQGVIKFKSEIDKNKADAEIVTVDTTAPITSNMAAIIVTVAGWESENVGEDVNMSKRFRTYHDDIIILRPLSNELDQLLRAKLGIPNIPRKSTEMDFRYACRDGWVAIRGEPSQKSQLLYLIKEVSQ